MFEDGWNEQIAFRVNEKTPIDDLEDRLLAYSVSIIKIVDQLPNTRTGNHVSGQLLKSGTSPYPNHGEA